MKEDREFDAKREERIARSLIREAYRIANDVGTQEAMQRAQEYEVATLGLLLQLLTKHIDAMDGEHGA